jgi:V/A-type H+/Na+-transporting ATPase subunit D
MWTAMARNNIAPTRSNLIRIKQELQFIREGYDILNRKREVLAGELIRVAHEAEEVQGKVWKTLEGAYRAIERAQLTMGREHVEWAALAVNKTVDIQIRSRGIMGVPIPQIETSGEPPEMPYSLGDTNAALDEASAAFREVLNQIPELSRLVTAVWRLAVELRKTQRRVNALQYIFIPEYEETISFIQSSLEEREREDIFQLKLFKNRQDEEHQRDPLLTQHEYEQPHF